MIKKGYTDGPNGKIHWRMASNDVLTEPDLYCFHPAPFSGLAFTGAMPYLAKGRRVVAPDYPGYGGSDVAEASIEAYAAAMGAVIDDVSSDGPIDVLGFHTGCFVAAELCLSRRDKIRRAILIDVPAFEDEKRLAFLSKMGPLTVTPDLACLDEVWTSSFVKRLESQPLDRSFEMFVEQLRPGVRMNDAFRAAFSYPWKTRIKNVQTPTRIIATQSPLLESSHTASKVMPMATLVERLDVKRAVLDEATETTSTEVLKFLSED